MNKLNSATLYEVLTDANIVKPTSQTCFENLFSSYKPDWKSISVLPRRETLDTDLRMFQYKLLNNVLYLNNMLFRFNKVDSPLSSYCNEEEEETPLNSFHSCLKTKQLWNKLISQNSKISYTPLHRVPFYEYLIITNTQNE